MNNLRAKKLGEVQAFAQVGLEFLDRGSVAAQKAFGTGMCADLRHNLRLQLAAAGANADSAKADRTYTKLRAMMDHYIGDEWDNPIELLEWSGFYFGAAAVHWHLVAKLSTDDFATAQAQLFESWLQAAGQRIMALAA